MLKKALNAVRFARAYITVVRDPNRTEMIFEVADRLVDEKNAEELERLYRSPELTEITERPLERLEIDLDYLRGLPEGTIGRAYADYMEANGFDPKLFDHTVKDTGPFSRVKAHLEGTHDLWHVATGFGTDVTGEVALQAFYFAQLDLPLSLVLMSGSLLNAALVERDTGDARLDAMLEGRQLGRRARSLCGVDWSARWEQPLAEFRAEFGLERLQPARLAA